MSDWFTHEIAGWKSWGAVFQSIPAFEGLIREMFHRENLPFQALQPMTPGTNAVFQSGPYVIKVYAPPEAFGTEDSTMKDMEVERFGLDFADRQNVKAPQRIASGVIEDRYTFPYLIQTFEKGTSFHDWTFEDAKSRRAFGRSLRTITDALNQPCQRFNPADVLFDEDRQVRWKAYTPSFQKDRLRTIRDWAEEGRFGPFVFVHGDLNEDNLLLNAPDVSDGAHVFDAPAVPQAQKVPQAPDITVLDFGDSCVAPIEYEWSLVAMELFRMDRDFLSGFFDGDRVKTGSAGSPAFHGSEKNKEEMAEALLRGILIHDFGADVLRQRFPGWACDKMKNVGQLREAIRRQLGKDRESAWTNND